MANTTIVRSRSAIAVGLFFTGITAFILLDDVLRHGASLTSRHVMTLAVLAGTVYFGHRFSIEARAWRIGTSLGCALLFLAGTITCVIMSAGRNAEAVTSKVLAANSVNTARQSAQNDRDEARLRYQAALKAEEQECSSGSGDRCQAKRITRKLRRDDYDAAEAVLRTQQPEQRANADVAAAAQLFARLPWVTAEAEAIEALLLLLFPFLMSLFCEIGAICGFAIGLGHAAQFPRQKVNNNKALPAPETAPETVSETVQETQKPVTPIAEATVLESWVPMSTAQAREIAKRLKADAVFEALREKAPLSNDELARELGVSKGESSRRVTALARAGLIRRQEAGRYVAISLRPLMH